MSFYFSPVCLNWFPGEQGDPAVTWNKNEPSEFTAASARLEAVARMRQSAQADAYELPPRQASQMIPLTIVFVLAAGLVLLAPGESLQKFFGAAMTGIDLVDGFLAGTAAAGDAEMNRLATTLARGFALFLMAGAAPLLAAMVTRLPGCGRVNPLVACWGALLALPLFYFLWGSF